jgi:hypothetical protein
MNSRKEAIRAYKERKIPRGIYQVRCATTGQIWVELSPDLSCARNSVWSQLRSKGHLNRKLQAVWDANGEATFEFAILETLDQDIAEMAIRDELKAKRKKWMAQLNALTVSP